MHMFLAERRIDTASLISIQHIHTSIHTPSVFNTVGHKCAVYLNVIAVTRMQ